jgi:hypothetical protein
MSLSQLSHKIIGTVATLAALALFATAAARAAWEPATTVSNQGSTTRSVGPTGDYTAIADGSGNGESTVFFEQTVDGSNGYYAIRRGGSAAGWSTPSATSFPPGTQFAVLSAAPIDAAADSQGNALAATMAIDSGLGSIFTAGWTASASSPSAFSELMKGSSSEQFTDPQIAFDGSGNAYAIAGVGQGSSSDEPIMISTLKAGATTWSTPSPIIVKNPGSVTTCTNSSITTTGEVCGEEPRFAVSPDGSVVVAFLETSSQIPMVSTQEQLYAAIAPAGAVLADGNTGGNAFTSIAKISGNPVPISAAPGAGSTDYPPNFDVAIDAGDVATIVDAEGLSGQNNQVFATQWALADAAPGSPVQLSAPSPPEPAASEPRVTTDPARDATVVWTEASQSSPPPADALMASELQGGKWSPPTTVTTSVDSPTNPTGYTVNTPPFWMAEDAGGTVFLVWTNSGSLQDSIRQLDKNWSAVDTIAGVSGATAGTARVAVGLVGQADALVVTGGGTLLASRFTGPLPPPRNAPPTATTGQASSVTQTGATLNGTLNPEGQDTKYYFQYGTSTSYTNSTPVRDAGSGITDTNVSAAISGLTPGTTYHFQLVAMNASGTVKGGDQAFTTMSPPGPPGALTEPASSITSSSATLNGLVNPDGVATSYYFEYGTSTGYGKKTPTQSAGAGTANVAVSAAITQLKPGTVIHFQLIATSSAGTTLGGDQSFTVPVPYRACRARPRSAIFKRLVRASRNRLLVRGTAGEPVCRGASPADRRRNHVSRVYVMIYRPAPHGSCRFLTRAGFLTRPIPCTRPIEFLARGTTSWVLILHIRIPPGIYLVRSDAVDGFGRHQRHSSASVVRVVVRPR